MLVVVYQLDDVHILPQYTILVVYMAPIFKPYQLMANLNNSVNLNNIFIFDTCQTVFFAT